MHQELTTLGRVTRTKIAAGSGLSGPNLLSSLDKNSFKTFSFQ